MAKQSSRSRRHTKQSTYPRRRPKPIYNRWQMKLRLLPARVITKAGIPCVIWAEDALAFAYCAPTWLFTLQLLVPDHLLQKARDTLVSTGYFSPAPLSEHEDLVEDASDNPDTPHAYPDSYYLKLRREELEGKDRDLYEALRFVHLNDILIHPASWFDFDIESKRTVCRPLKKSYANIQFPTVASFLDGLAAVLLCPPDGLLHEVREATFMRWLFSLDGRLSPDASASFRVDEGGVKRLVPAYQKIIRRVDRANRPFFKAFHLHDVDIARGRAERIKVLRKRAEGSGVPFVHPPPVRKGRISKSNATRRRKQCDIYNELEYSPSELTHL